ncbi:hypothetical protein B9Z55_016986 [Caenorhabditis nigoni]|uniref:DUF7809 domain-containing protein n=1 Tax=Caenorhabditis nigoni TaxID=1611254 RepID=A0A2G5T7H9_9PELO|nr:hypothetical protein B9Z55_016986 [Caenorhabditis nigoni]
MSFLTKPSLPSNCAIFRAYLPEEHWGMIFYIDGEPTGENTDPILNYYYGGVGPLFKQVENFRNFPGNLNKFLTELSTPYPVIPPIIYTSLKNEQYIFKQDLLSQMQQKAYSKFLTDDTKNLPVQKVVAIYLRTKELELNGLFELIRYDAEKFEDFRKNVDRRVLNLLHLPKTNKLKKKTFEEFFGIIKKMMPVNKYDPEFTQLRDHLQFVHKKSPVAQNKQLYEHLINVITIITSEFDALINANKFWFLPYSADVETPPTPIIRLFNEDATNKKRFMIGAEILYELRRCGMNPLPVEKALRNKPPMETMQYRDLLTLIGAAEMGKITFVLTPIIRTQKRGIWIPAGSSYCMYALDVIYEIIDWVVFKGIFIGVSREKRDKILEILKSLKYVLDDFDKGIRVILEVDIRRINEELTKTMRENDITIPAVQRQIRPQILENFTSETLKDELLWLGVAEQFPEILDLSYNLFENRKYCVIEDPNICGMVESVQVLAIINRLLFHEYFDQSWYVRS